MAVTKKEKITREFWREEKQNKKCKNLNKLDEQILESFRKLNNKSCYDFLDDTESKSFQNMLDFMTLMEKRCEREYGKKKKYSKEDVEYILCVLFPNPTETQAKTIRKMNKVFKKNKKQLDEFYEFKFTALLSGKNIPTYDENPYADEVEAGYTYDW